jgi:hypothetical protein
MDEGGNENTANEVHEALYEVDLVHEQRRAAEHPNEIETKANYGYIHSCLDFIGRIALLLRGGTFVGSKDITLFRVCDETNGDKMSKGEQETSWDNLVSCPHRTGT